MDIIDITDVDLSVLERTNPVFNTAKMTLFDMANAGDEDARAISEALGLTQEETQNSRTVVATPAQVIASTLTVETRFRTMGEMAARSGCATVVDLPCGYTPRAIQFARKGIPYVGLDLPATIAEAEPAITSLLTEDERALVSFCGVDATNNETLRHALKDVQGPICITTEGLFPYFTRSEADVVCDNICRLLQEHGGCWISCDPEIAIAFVISLKTVFGDDFRKVYASSHRRASEKSDFEVGRNGLIVDMTNPREGMPASIAYLASHGLAVERLAVDRKSVV